MSSAPKRGRPVGLSALLGLLATLTASLAQASLGNEVASIEHDRLSLNGVTEVTAEAKFERHEIAYAGGHVRQYVTGGRVFAVAWDGTAAPDLKLLLGDYHARYLSMVRPQPGAHHVVNVSGDGLTISVQTILRSHRGQVVVTALVPPGAPVASLP